MEKEIIFVLLPPYADWEGAFIAPSLHNAIGVDGTRFLVKTLSLTADPIVSMGGFTVLPDYSLETLPDRYEALILIGGLSWFSKEAELLLPVVQDAMKNNRLIAGICNASVFLAQCGLLNEVKHTSNTLEYLTANAGEGYTGKANYINKQAVSDNNIITANGTACLEFCREILIWLKADTPERIEEKYLFNKTGFCKD